MRNQNANALPKRGPDKVKYRRGRVAGIIPVTFLADMVALSYFTTLRVLQKWLKATGKTEEQLTPREIGEFVEYCADQRKPVKPTAHDDFRYME